MLLIGAKDGPQLLQLFVVFRVGRSECISRRCIQLGHSLTQSQNAVVPTALAQVGNTALVLLRGKLFFKAEVQPGGGKFLGSLIVQGVSLFLLDKVIHQQNAAARDHKDTHCQQSTADALHNFFFFRYFLGRTAQPYVLRGQLTEGVKKRIPIVVELRLPGQGEFVFHVRFVPIVFLKAGSQRLPQIHTSPLLSQILTLHYTKFLIVLQGYRKIVLRFFTSGLQIPPVFSRESILQGNSALHFCTFVI